MGATSSLHHQRRCPAVVTLVPGTWSGKAAWTEPDSRLSRALTTNSCVVVPFPWSHANSYRARTRAADRLAEHLRRQIEENPGSRHWVVAHSHGGNIALHAVRRLKESCPEAPPVSTITLATPFIHARRRTFTGWWSIYVLAFSGVLLLGAAGNHLIRHPFWHDWQDRTEYVSALAIIELLLVVLGAGMHWGFLRHGILRWVWKKMRANPELWWAEVINALRSGRFIEPGYPERLIASVHSPRVEAQEVFVIRAAGDEASSGLAIGQFLGWISAAVNPLLTNLWVWAWILIAAEGSILLTLRFPDARSVFVIALYAAVILALLAVLAVSLMLAAAVPFGWDGPFLSAFASCSAEAAPPGQVTILQMEPKLGAGRRGLAHSGLYQSEVVIDRIARLISDSTVSEET